MAKKENIAERMPFQEVLKEIALGSDRVAVILAASLLDELLKDTIRYNFVPLTGGEQEDLFDGTAALSTFSARIKIAYAMGLISKKLRIDLDGIRDLRNVFAHRLTRPEIISGKAIDRVRQLNALEKKTMRGKKLPALMSEASKTIAEFLIIRTITEDPPISDMYLRTLASLDFEKSLGKKLRDTVGWVEI